MRRLRSSHFHSTIEILPGQFHPVHMTIDNGMPPWVRFRMKGRRTVVAMPLTEFVSLGFRRAQVRYAEAKLGTEPKEAPPTFDGFLKSVAEDCINAE